MNNLFVFGVNYLSADLAVREKLAFTEEKIPSVLNRLQNSGICSEMVILSTCNRSEIYCIASDIDFVINAICEIQNICPRTVRKYGYIYQDKQCVRHLFRVVCGLDSMVLGESEIVAQVKSALNIAISHGSAVSVLSTVFQMALGVEKDVRSTVKINSVTTSIGKALSGLVSKEYADLVKQKLLFIGAGSMMQQLVVHFNTIKAHKKSIVNRTLKNAENLAKLLDADYYEFNMLDSIVNDYTVIIACCGGGQNVLNEQLLGGIINNKQQKTLLIDLSMPLITDLNLRKHDHITVLTIDDIAKLVDVGLKKRKQLALEAENLIELKLLAYQNWVKKRSLTPVIKALRDSADEIRQEALVQAKRQLDNGESPLTVITELSIRLTNRLLHNPTVNLYSGSDKAHDELANLIAHLYDLDVSNQVATNTSEVKH